MDDEEFDEEDSEGKISIVVGVLGTFVFAVLDLISIIPGVGDLEDIVGVLGFIVGLATNVGPMVSTTLGMVIIIKGIPGVQSAVPAWTIGWWAVWFATNHQNTATRLALKAAREAGSAEQGGGVGAEGIEGGAMGGAEGMAQIGNEAGQPGRAEGHSNEETGGGNKENAAPDGPEKSGQDLNENDFTPREERAPMENVGEDIDLPKGDFGSWDGNNEENSSLEEEQQEGEAPTGGAAATTAKKDAQGTAGIAENIPKPPHLPVDKDGGAETSDARDFDLAA